jgi:predicted MPP superfamily phosphohydrolase
MSNLSRRQVIKRALVATAGLGGAAGLYTWRVEPHWLDVVTRPMPLRNLPADLVGRTLVLMSDLHIGPQVDDDYVIDCFQRASALRPDYVVIVGDFISYRGPGQFDQLTRVLQHLPHGSRTTVATLGNHDYGPQWSHPEIAERVATIVTNAGARVLRNQVTNVEGLQFVGLDDLWAHRFDPAAAMSLLDPGAAVIALSHNPDTVDRPGWAAFTGWVLSGHTHGGQCKPPFLPPPLLPVQNSRYTRGEFELSEKRRLYISRGVGHLLRVRFNVRPEITLFRLSHEA